MLNSENINKAKEVIKEFPFETIIFLSVFLSFINGIFIALSVILSLIYLDNLNNKKHIREKVYESAFEESMTAIRESIKIISTKYPKKVTERLNKKIEYFSNIKPHPKDQKYYKEYFDFCVAIYLTLNTSTQNTYKDNLYETYKIRLENYNIRISEWENDPFKNEMLKPDFEWLELKDNYEIFIILSKENKIKAYSQLVNIVSPTHMLHPRNFPYEIYHPQSQRKIQKINSHYKKIFEQLFEE